MIFNNLSAAPVVPQALKLFRAAAAEKTFAYAPALVLHKPPPVLVP
jgi:hypothetical protein